MKPNFKNLYLILTQTAVALTITFAQSQAADFSALKINESEVSASLKESQKVTDEFMGYVRKAEEWSPVQKAMVQKYVDAFKATQESIRMG